jgi:hypothetical protein
MREATRESKLTANRKSLHGRLVHELVAVGNTILTEQISYRARHKQFGKSVGLRAPGMFIALLKRTGAAYGRHPGGNSYAYHLKKGRTKARAKARGAGGETRSVLKNATRAASGQGGAASAPNAWPR